MLGLQVGVARGVAIGVARGVARGVVNGVQPTLAKEFLGLGSDPGLVCESGLGCCECG